MGSASGVTQQQQVLLSQVAYKSNKKFEYMTLEDKKETRDNAEEP